MDDEKILGIEGGGTKTAWALVANGAIIESGKLPPSNLRLTPLDQITKIFHILPREVDRIGVFLAGCVTKEDRAVLLKLVRAVWPRAKIVAGSDRDSGMAACLRDRDGIAVNAGTGSSVTGRSGRQIEKAGGWGHILGDAGGAYFVSIRALRSVLREYDLRRGEREFAANILRALGLNNFDELVRWAQTADKMEIASLAPVVFDAARKSDEAARQIIAAGVGALVDFTTAVSMRLQLETPEVRLMGGLFENQKFYGVAFATALSEKIPGAEVDLCESPPEVGAAWLAADERLQLAKAEERAAAVQLDFIDRGGESEISQPRPIKCPRNRGAFRGGRKIGGGRDCANASINWPGRSNCRPARLAVAGASFTWAPERVAGSVFLMPLKFRQPLARQQICFRESLPGARRRYGKALKARRTMRARVRWRWMSAGSSGRTW